MDISSGVSLFQSVIDCLEEPLWWLEWECGCLQAEKEFLDSCTSQKCDTSDLSAYRWYVWAGWAGKVTPNAPASEDASCDPEEEEITGSNVTMLEEESSSDGLEAHQ